jgi:hypothetical protein
VISIVMGVSIVIVSLFGAALLMGHELRD